MGGGGGGHKGEGEGTGEGGRAPVVEREGMHGQWRGKGACVGVRVRAQERRGRMCACGREGGHVQAAEREGTKRRAKEGVRRRGQWGGGHRRGRACAGSREGMVHERGWGQGQCPSQ